MEDLSNKSNFKQSSVPPKSGMKDMLKKPEYAKNKVYDKKSGTGRGKEISKGGAGGKFTWGTGDKQVEQELNEEEYEHKEPGDKGDFYMTDVAKTFENAKDALKEIEKLEDIETLLEIKTSDSDYLIDKTMIFISACLTCAELNTRSLKNKNYITDKEASRRAI